MWSPIFTQAIYYGVVLILAIFIVSFMQKGFFWKFIRVKLSFGSRILVEKRSIPNYTYRVGFTEGGFLKFKDKKEGRSFVNRIALPEGKNVFYKSMGCWRVDIDPDKNCLLEPSLVGIQSYDPQRFDELMAAAIEAKEPSKEKIILISLVILGILVGVSLYFLYNNSKVLEQIMGICGKCAECKSAAAAVPTPANI